MLTEFRALLDLYSDETLALVLKKFPEIKGPLRITEPNKFSALSKLPKFLESVDIKYLLSEGFGVGTNGFSALVPKLSEVRFWQSVYR